MRSVDERVVDARRLEFGSVWNITGFLDNLLTALTTTFHPLVFVFFDRLAASYFILATPDDFRRTTAHIFSHMYCYV